VGNAHEFAPSFHVRYLPLRWPLFIFHPLQHEDYHGRFNSYFKRIEDTYSDGKPLHLSNPSKSVIATLSHAEYIAMPSKQLKALMVKQHVVVTACPDPLVKFDEEGLQTLAPMHLPVSLQGQ